MKWGSLQDFLAMGGYAKFVWGSYAVCAIAFAVEWILLARRHRAARRRRAGMETEIRRPG